MSYPSIVEVSRRRGVTLEGASEAEMRTMLLEAFWKDLPLGMRYLEDAARKVLTGGRRLLKIEDPNSPLGRQLIRLLGADIARSIVEEHYRVAFGLYNCCGVVAAPTRESLAMGLREQIQLQDGTLASADC